ncbi:riboflavin biosynthesis protein RibF [Clostridium swellfunianum]|uniref:riboflavin biosynthesis protein RibF n=1 Tax=Clostridium swellfunianum TaxID=1367462 RepID=UPI002030828A|nr:riboflavin biosynthesis protein RibF [Clostridium swellfunianum]
MRYISGNDFIMKNTCVAFGSFDGVHTGHHAVINRLIDASKERLTSVVLSFEYDESLLKDRKVLSTEEEKQYLLSKNGPEVMISYKISEENKDISIEQFIKDILLDKLGAQVIVAGENDSNICVLRECAQRYEYKLVECGTVLTDDEPVTSRRIIKELEEGNLQKANELLGHPYLLMGKVMHGKALGRTVGMPTANLGYGEHKQLPTYGVYGTLSEIEGEKVKGLTNIGKRPSVDNYNYVTIEAFLLDFSGDLYDKTITLETHVFIRGVKKFNNLDEVKAQVNNDIESIRAYLDGI